jgi:hypothetical protein
LRGVTNAATFGEVLDRRDDGLESAKPVRGHRAIDIHKMPASHGQRNPAHEKTGPLRARSEFASVGAPAITFLVVRRIQRIPE